MGAVLTRGEDVSQRFLHRKIGIDRGIDGLIVQRPDPASAEPTPSAASGVAVTPLKHRASRWRSEPSSLTATIAAAPDHGVAGCGMLELQVGTPGTRAESRHRHRGQESRASPTAGRQQVDEEALRPRSIAHRPCPPLRCWLREPAPPRADRKPDRRGSSCHRWCRGCAPAGSPISPAASATSGQDCASSSDEAISAWVVKAPMRTPPSTAEIPRRSERPPISINCEGCARRSFIIGSRLWPPAISFASSF